MVAAVGGVEVDAKNPTRYSVYLGSGGMGLPDRDYYTDTTEKGENIKAKYKEYLTFLMGEAGFANAARLCVVFGQVTGTTPTDYRRQAPVTERDM